MSHSLDLDVTITEEPVVRVGQHHGIAVQQTASSSSGMDSAGGLPQGNGNGNGNGTSNMVDIGSARKQRGHYATCHTLGGGGSRSRSRLGWGRGQAVSPVSSVSSVEA